MQCQKKLVFTDIYAKLRENDEVKRCLMAENRVAVVAIIVENMQSAAEVNAILHEFGEYIIGRMGLPYRERRISIINIVLDAPVDKINTLAGKLGRLNGVTAKAVCSAV